MTHDPMLKIGEFSQLAQVTVKTLHHYDQLDLLKPAHIDRSSGYRYYTVAQLPRIHRIMALKELGLSLDQISVLLREDLPTEQIRGMLRLRQSEVEQQVRDATRQLAMIEFRLRMIDAEANFPDLDVVIKRLDELHCVTLFLKTAEKEPGGDHFMAHLVESINRATRAGLLRFTGDTYDVFHGDPIVPFSAPDIGDQQHEIWLGVEAGQTSFELEGVGQFTARTFPQVATAATLVIANKEGPPLHEFTQAALLRRWAVAQGYEPSDVMRYRHHRGPMQTLNIQEFVLEAQLPIDVPD